MGAAGAPETGVWEPWRPDAAGLRALARWRRPRRLWVDDDLTAESLPPEQRARVLEAMASAPRHRFAVAAADPGALSFAVFSWSAGHGRAPLPGHVALGVTVGDDPARGKAGLAGLDVLPVASAFLFVAAPALRPEALWEWVRAGTVGRVLVDGRVADQSPRWTAALMEAGQREGVPIELLRLAAPRGKRR
jgi:hypothetical protein